MSDPNDTHSKVIGYVLWIFGFTGAHRFYYGKPITGTIWFFTLGLLFIGWIVDLFLIPGMDEAASRKYKAGKLDYNVAWVLLTFLFPFGAHRFYMGKWISALIFLAITVSGTAFFPLLFLLSVGYLYDLWTLNGQVDEINREVG